jgi:hypothetical protein
MIIELRVVNYTSTDEEGDKIYTRHALQTRTFDIVDSAYSRDIGPWTDVPLVEIHEERGVEEEKIYIVDRQHDILMAKLKDDLDASREARTAAIKAYDAAVEAMVRGSE